VYCAAAREAPAGRDGILNNYYLSGFLPGQKFSRAKLPVPVPLGRRQLRPRILCCPPVFGRGYVYLAPCRCRNTRDALRERSSLPGSYCYNDNNTALSRPRTTLSVHVPSPARQSPDVHIIHTHITYYTSLPIRPGVTRIYIYITFTGIPLRSVRVYSRKPDEFAVKLISFKLRSPCPESLKLWIPRPRSSHP